MTRIASGSLTTSAAPDPGSNPTSAGSPNSLAGGFDGVFHDGGEIRGADIQLRLTSEQQHFLEVVFQSLQLFLNHVGRAGDRLIAACLETESFGLHEGGENRIAEGVRDLVDQPFLVDGRVGRRRADDDRHDATARVW